MRASSLLENRYQEIEFICANPEFPEATDPQLQQDLYQKLKTIDGVIPLYQDWDDHSEGQKSLTAIFKSPAAKKAILAAAKQLGVGIDLIRPVDDWYVDQAIRGDHQGQII